MSDVAELGRRFDILAGEVRDLVRWLKDDLGVSLKDIRDAIILLRHHDADADKQIAALRVDVHAHGRRITALEAKTKKGKRT